MEHEPRHILQDWYKLEILEARLLRERGKRKVWYIRTNKGEYCFKKYDEPLHKYDFSFALQEHLMNIGSRIPRLIPTSNRQLYAQDERGVVYVLFEWIHGSKAADLHNSNDLKRGLSTLGLFHRDALSFSLPEQIKGHRRYRLDLSKENSELKKLKGWNIHLLGKKRLSLHRSLIEQAEETIDGLHTKMKSGALEEETNKGYIAHNDFADINLLSTKDKTYIIDLDDAAYNFPTVDIELIFRKTCFKRLIPPKLIPLWFHSYESSFRLAPTMKQYLIYHLQLPTIYRHIVNNRAISEEQHQLYTAIVNWELEKNKVLQNILKQDKLS